MKCNRNNDIHTQRQWYNNLYANTTEVPYQKNNFTEHKTFSIQSIE